MKHSYSITIYLLGLLIPTLSFGDGRSLTPVTLAPNDASVDWAMELNQYGIQISPSKITLDNGKILTGDAIILRQSNFPLDLFLTETRPAQLYCYVDRNGTYRANEGYSDANAKQDSPNPEYCFQNVRIPLQHKLAPMSFAVSIAIRKAEDNYHHSIEFGPCKSIYEGSLLIGQQTYAARMVFHLPNEHRKEVTTTIVLDTNRDGVFHLIDDTWFSENGYGYVDGQFWTVKIGMEGETAQVDFERYNGATGILQLQGEGIAQVCIGKSTPSSTVLRTGAFLSESEFSLPYREDLSYHLPVGDYVLYTVWLQPKGQKDVVYQWPMSRDSRSEYSSIRIEENQSFPVNVGGPLRDSIRVEPFNIFGDIVLEYRGGINPLRYPFIEKNHDDLLHTDEFKQPLWTIKDHRGNVILAGQFTSGYKETVRMPFFSRGTYQVQRPGSDNELIDRTPVPFVYHSRLPLIWGIVILLIFGCLTYLYFIDLDYPFSKWWVLFPGIAGFLLIYFSPQINLNSFDLSIVYTCPVALTGILLACRIFLPSRISSVFFTSSLSSIAILYPTHVLFQNAAGALINFIFISMVYSILFSAFYLIVRGKGGGKRFLLAFISETFIPPLLLVMPLIVIERDVEYAIVFPLFLLIFCVFTIPLYVLVVLNPWVRDLIVNRMIESDKNETPEEEEILKPVA